MAKYKIKKYWYNNYKVEAYEIWIPVYDKYVYVTFGEENYNKVGLSDDYGTFQAAVVSKKDEYDVTLVLKNCADITHEIIAHEALHILYQISKYTGMKFHFDDQEPTCYLLGYIVEEIYRVIETEKQRVKMKKQKLKRK